MAVERGPAADHRRLPRRPVLNDPIQLIGQASPFGDRRETFRKSGTDGLNPGGNGLLEHHDALAGLSAPQFERERSAWRDRVLSRRYGDIRRVHRKFLLFSVEIRTQSVAQRHQPLHHVIAGQTRRIAINRRGDVVALLLVKAGRLDAERRQRDPGAAASPHG